MSMLAMNPLAMRAMDDEHLLASLDAQGPLTPAEEELAGRLGGALDELEYSQKERALLAERMELMQEQSGFRAQLLEQIKKLCEQEGTKKDLVRAIKMAFENSYVEL